MSVSDAMMRKGIGAGEARAARWRERIARAADAMPGVRAHVDGEEVVMEGRHLLDRWLRDATLRQAGRTDI